MKSPAKHDFFEVFVSYRNESRQLLQALYVRFRAVKKSANSLKEPVAAIVQFRAFIYRRHSESIGCLRSV